jgi:PAS domain S-box-containing protein
VSRGTVRRVARLVVANRLAAVAVVLFCIAVASATALSLRSDRQALLLGRSWEIETQLASLLSTLQEAESGQRGFLLTGEDAYLAPYRRAVPALTAAFDRLETLLADEPGGHDAVAALRPLVAAKLDELGRSLDLYRSGQPDAARAAARTDRGARLTARLRQEIATIGAAEERRLAMRRDAAAWLRQLITGTVLAAAIMAIALALAWALGVRRTARRLRASGDALRAANRRLLESGRELDRIFQVSRDIIAVIDRDGRFRRLSPAWERVTGHSADAGLGQPFLDFVHPDDRPATDAALAHAGAAGPRGDFLNRYRHADGTWRWISWRGAQEPQSGLIYSIGRDVTAERMREEQLRQSQKMEAVGQLTGGIAHDFNNLLTIIAGSLELLLRGLRGADPKLARRAEAAMEGARRAAALTQQLLAFSRRQPLAPASVDVNRLVEGMSALLGRTLGAPIAIRTLPAEDLWPTLVDPNQLENAILNLALNARDAMPAGGRLTIETGNVHLDQAQCASAGGVAPGDYVMIAVSDTGTGMTPEAKARAFEPFFTTKPIGHGTGLGLAQVYGFVRQSGGHVSLDSAPGQGTSVRLLLPRLCHEPAPVAPADRNPAGVPAAAGETVLVVEDEAGVRAVAVEALEALGYRVLAAGTAAEALSLLRATPRIDLLLADMVLGDGMDGQALAEASRRLVPGLPVLFTTGHLRGGAVRERAAGAGVAVIDKPFTIAALARQVREALDRARAAA